MFNRHRAQRLYAPLVLVSLVATSVAGCRKHTDAAVKDNDVTACSTKSTVGSGLGSIASSLLGFIPYVGTAVGAASRTGITALINCDPNKLMVEKVGNSVDQRLSGLSSDLNDLQQSQIRDSLQFFSQEMNVARNSLELDRHVVINGGSSVLSASTLSLAKTYIQLATTFQTLTNKIKGDSSVVFLAAAFDMGVAYGAYGMLDIASLISRLEDPASGVDKAAKEAFYKGFTTFGEQYVFFLDAMAQRKNDAVASGLMTGRPRLIVDQILQYSVTAPVGQTWYSASNSGTAQLPLYCINKESVKIKFTNTIGNLEYHYEGFGGKTGHGSLTSDSLQGTEISLGYLTPLKDANGEWTKVQFNNTAYTPCEEPKSTKDDEASGQLKQQIGDSIIYGPEGGQIAEFVPLRRLVVDQVAMFDGIDSTVLDNFSKAMQAYFNANPAFGYKYNKDTGTGTPQFNDAATGASGQNGLLIGAPVKP